MSLQKELQARILDLPDVELKNGAFWRDKREFAHFHGPHTIGVRLTKEKIKVLKPDYRLTISYPPRDWLEVHFDEEADLNYVMKLLEQAYKANILRAPLPKGAWHR